MWLPNGSAGNNDFEDFSTAKQAVGVFSISLNAYMSMSNGLKAQFVDTDARATDIWRDGSTEEFLVIPMPSGGVVTVTGWCGELVKFNVSDNDMWTGWFDIDVGIVMTSDGNITLYYYINGVYVGNATKVLKTVAKKIDGVYFNGYTSEAGSGFMFDNVAFGYSIPKSTNNSDIFQGEGYTGGDQGGNQGGTDVEEDFYIEEIDQSQVTNSILKAVVNGKFKQCDQCTERNKQGGTPVYVTADKNGETVQALYVSRTYAWTGSEEEDFTEFRFDCVGKVISISFDYKIKGTVEKNEKHLFTDLDGNKFYADAYLQIKTPTKHAGAGDDYPELSGTDFNLDGEWHTLTYTFTEPTEIINILINLYHFRGEMLIANINADFIA